MFFFFLQWGCLLFWYKYCIMYLKHVLASHTDKVVAHENRADLNMDSLIWFPFFSARPPLSRAVRAQGWEGFSSPPVIHALQFPKHEYDLIGKKIYLQWSKESETAATKDQIWSEKGCKGLLSCFPLLVMAQKLTRNQLVGG